MSRTALAAVVLLSSAAAAQQYVISTYAGGAPPLAAPIQATSVSIGAPISVAADEKGNVYFASPDLNAVFKLDPSGLLTRIAGSSQRVIRETVVPRPRQHEPGLWERLGAVFRVSRWIGRAICLLRTRPMTRPPRVARWNYHDGGRQWIARLLRLTGRPSTRNSPTLGA